MAINLARLNLRPAQRLYGAAVLYRAQGEASTALRAVFDRTTQLLEFPGAAAQSIAVVRLGVELAAFAPGITPGQGDVVTVALLAGQQIAADRSLPTGGVLETFIVTDVQQDGPGGAVLALAEWSEDA